MSGGVRLRWSTHQSTIVSMLDTFLEDESLVDVALTCEGHTLHAHKLILSACSPYLQKMLDTKERIDPIIFLTGVKFTQLKALIQFIYRGEVNISQEDLPSFLTLAEELQIRGLANEGDTESATQRIRSTILEGNTRNCNTIKAGPDRVMRVIQSSNSPPPLKKARSSIASLDNTATEDFQTGFARSVDSVSTENETNMPTLSAEEEQSEQYEQIEYSDDKDEVVSGDGEEQTSIQQLDDSDDEKLARAAASRIVKHCDWKALLTEDDNSADRFSISDQEISNWQYMDPEGLEMIPDDEDDDDDIQELPASRNYGADNEPSACPLCNKQFAKRKTWNTHCLYDCPLVPPKYSCPKCEYRARRGYQLKIHCLKIHGIGIV